MGGGIDLVIVGGGIVGLATAHRVMARAPSRRVVVVEREHGVGRHQSSHNSGVLHAGVYYAPGSLKAQFCRTGKQAMERFCDEHGIPVQRLGKLVVAVDESELGRLEELTARATANGTPDLAVLDASQLRAVEPHVHGLAALHSPTTAVVEFGAVCGQLATGLDVRLGATVDRLVERGDRVVVETSSGAIEARAAVVCAGLWTERLARA